eukprot:878211-Rhodomonas_salina.1
MSLGTLAKSDKSPSSVSSYTTTKFGSSGSFKDRSKPLSPARGKAPLLHLQHLQEAVTSSANTNHSTMKTLRRRSTTNLLPNSGGSPQNVSDSLDSIPMRSSVRMSRC